MLRVYARRTDGLLPEEVDRVRLSMPKRYEKALGYRNEAVRDSCLAGALLMTEAVPGFSEERLVITPQGKPVLPRGMWFNLSHSGKLAVLAVDDEPVGIDVEDRSARRFIKVAERVCVPEELRWMEEDPQERFFVLWTMKESVLKCLGTGFLGDPKKIVFAPEPEEAGYHAETAGLQVTTVYCGDYVISCAAQERWDGSFSEL